MQIAGRVVMSRVGRLRPSEARGWGALGVIFVTVIIAGLVIGLRSHPRSPLASGASGVLPDQAALVTRGQIRHEPADSPQRSFLQYWFDLQNQAFVDAVQFYSPLLVASLGSARLVTALQSEVSYFGSTEPRIMAVSRSGPQVTLLYKTRSAGSAFSAALSVTWTRIGGAWRIFYDPFLNTALRQAAENAISPGTAPSLQARQAGEQAARLQAVYLQQAEGK